MLTNLFLKCMLYVYFVFLLLTGSPHQCSVLDPESVQVTGHGVAMATANMPTGFIVNMENAGDAELNVKVLCKYQNQWFSC